MDEQYDFMELPNGLVPLKDGWFLERKTGNRIDPSGRVYNDIGEIIKDPTEDK